MTAIDRTSPLVWIDCEMTGLDAKRDVILEIFCIITNGQLEVLDEEGWGAVIQQPKKTLDNMGEWCTRVHGLSGLTAAVLSSITSPEEAAHELLSYVKQYVPEPRIALLAGNSVHADKLFLQEEPYREFHDYLHYRIFDVSTIKEAANRWSPKMILESLPRKTLCHKARNDILESIEEARYYKKMIFQHNGGN
ncbi:Bgt-933 [Blumeria graminis f. sp. tritici]|uniref:Bgt-933 n=2 Tax=Blumeria graminis f. sp. tritici TaxID=62690 RepID=A0A381LIV1_BLUGR|nr:RNA exonuclease [Blumeria graminis f. sp. tritici 96224]VDB89505.1 Bgt-933 [Blumeria graminis f. sp. tritici]